MKLFIWNNPYELSYGGAYAFAIAETVEEARKAIRAGKATPYGLTGGIDHPVPSVMDIDREPDSIHEGPFGRVYEWEE